MAWRSFILSDGRILITDTDQLLRFTADSVRDVTFGLDGALDYSLGTSSLLGGASVNNLFSTYS